MDPALSYRPFVHSYLFLRRAVGVIGTALPLVLIIGNAVSGGGLLFSISGSYYTVMSGVFVGSMCAVGVFLLSYYGFTARDDIASSIAGIAAIGVALCPTTPDDPSTLSSIVGDVHAVCAAVFFTALASFCLYFFGNENAAMPDTTARTVRGRVFLACGSVILLCLVLVAVVGLWLYQQLVGLHPVLWLEAIAIFAFGVSWIVAGYLLAPIELAAAPVPVAASEPVAVPEPVVGTEPLGGAEPVGGAIG